MNNLQQHGKEIEQFCHDFVKGGNIILAQSY